MISSSIIKTFAVALMATAYSASANAQGFTVKGNIKGVKDGTRVALRFRDGGAPENVETLTKGGSFELKGTIKSPMMTTIEIDDRPKSEVCDTVFPYPHGVNFILENTDYTISAACFDSIPQCMAVQGCILPKYRNVTVKGGKAQEQYAEWMKTNFKEMVDYEKADNDYRQERYFSEGGFMHYDTVKVEALSRIKDEKEQVLNAANRRFIDAHPDYAISLMLQTKETKVPFCYTADELDAMLKKFSGNYDQERLKTFAETVEKLKKYPRGAHYTDVNVQTPDGKDAKWSEYIKKGKYNFVDCWASWCGPCRAAIPSVKEMYKRLGDKVNIISVSVDKKNADWQKALKEENMPWPQFVVTKEGSDQLHKDYSLTFVPSLIVIDPEGCIQVFTSDPDLAHRYLEEHAK